MPENFHKPAAFKAVNGIPSSLFGWRIHDADGDMVGICLAEEDAKRFVASADLLAALVLARKEIVHQMKARGLTDKLIESSATLYGIDAALAKAREG